MSTEMVPAAGAPCRLEQHEEFARRLAVHGNAAAAYRAAYPDASPATVNAKASPLAKHPDVARRVAELRRARHEQLLKDTEDLEVLVGNLALGKAAELVDEDGDPIPLHELPVHVKAAISAVELDLDEDGKVSKYKLKFPDPLAAMRLLAQLRGQLVDRKDVTSGGRPVTPVPAEQLPEDLEQELRRRLLPGSLNEPIDGKAEVVDDCSDLV